MATNSSRIDFDRVQRERWQALFYVLAGFSIVAVVFGLTLNHQLLELHFDTLHEDAVLNELQTTYGELATLASAVNEPGNKVFEDNDVEGAQSRLAEAAAAFEARVRGLERRIDNDGALALGDRVRPRLTELVEQHGRVVSEANAIFDALRREPPADAGPAMSRMDSAFYGVNERLRMLESQARDVATQALADRSARARLLRGFEIGFATFVVLLVIFVTIHGRRLAMQIVSDTETREAMHAEIEDAEERLRTILERANDGIVHVDARGDVRTINRAAAALFGVTADDALGKPIEYLVPELGARLGESAGRFVELTGRRPSGTFALEVGVSEMELRGERHLIAVMRDVSERKRFETELIDARRAAEDAARAKSDFLATMSHEIRTPLNGVIGMNATLLASDLKPDQRDAATTIAQCADHLLTLINDVLDYSKLESGRAELEVVDMDVETLLESVVEILGASARDKGLTLVHSIDSDVPRRIRSDPARIRQVLMNFVGNAVKFTPRGEVEIVASRVRHDGADFLRFTVRDTGIGIPADRRDRLFRRFSQVDASTTRRFGGTGLGLAICREIVERLGGRVGVESESGKGSTFFADVPFLGSSAVGSAAAEPGVLAGKAVLVVVANPTERRVLAQWLRDAGATKVTERSGPEAADDDAGDFDYVFHDDLRGDSDRVHELPAEAGRSRHVLLSGSIAPSRHDDARNQGWHGVVAKPLRRSRVLSEVRQLEQNLAAGHVDGPVASSAPRSQRSLSILLAEDNAVNQKIARLLLERLGHRVTVASNGREAVAAVKAGRFDLVLMDCQMPEMDGLTATREIRGLATEASRTPIVAMTANALAGDREQCVAAGMDGYVTKPVRVEELVAEIATVMARIPHHEDPK